MVFEYKSPIGPLWIVESAGFISGIYFSRDRINDKDINPQTNMSPAAKTCFRELDEYFAGELQRFTVPIMAKGTSFREGVWDALSLIPYGQTISYMDLAISINKPRAVRAVGGANHHNPISIIIPCHRVIGKNGKLVGYGGGLDVKEFLLLHEQKYKKGEKV